MLFSSLKNRLRSRTRVTIVMFQKVWCFEESAPFSYTCRNCGVPERVVFWTIGSVLAHVWQLLRSITFWMHARVRVFSDLYFVFVFEVRIKQILNLRFKHRGMKPNQINHIKSNQFNQIKSNQSINQSFAIPTFPQTPTPNVPIKLSLVLSVY